MHSPSVRAAHFSARVSNIPLEVPRDLRDESRCHEEAGRTDRIDYIVKVSGVLAKVRITRESPHGGWYGTNLATGREIRVRGAARLRRPVNEQ